MANAKVLVVMGSSSDFPVMEESRKLLNELGIECRMSIASAHRTPAKVEKLASSAASDGVKVIIAGAGYAAHLAGNLAAHTILPIIGVPLEGSSLGGLDSLIATVQMPGGVPVATVTIGKTGAKNAAVLAAQIIALSDKSLAEKLTAYKKSMADGVEAADKNLNS
ncbi:MAG TPA: 5-(carboxyamino)imidazole ribonucleotide mutase [bacterium]|nr:MAG: N5-carboxyaminoimidazole ribonucleotide mutase [bacterium ADurb.Bin270]HPW45042.1 5-(carboxyamino)imidazole ribonucleotide mutase [bacterium]HQC50789.1 5-(carboxyamino)imidazole ribonucleotide mutase [bacterium]HQG13508.1 5-(carboxyamino)imidazole ribonucleotide mutase [bacterium]